MSAQPVIAWLTACTRDKLRRMAYERGVYIEELAGDLVTEGL